ncbi:MAG: hypothetical protein H0U73_00740 [Tatlockia sp.]|nr:hypothetical protein [Tatlockia sp.]
MKISVGQALLILLDKYRHNNDKFIQLKKLYLIGAKDIESLDLINRYLMDDSLKKYEISRDPVIINNDGSRRYFETHLSYETIYQKIDKVELKELNNYSESVQKLVPVNYSGFGNMLLVTMQEPQIILKRSTAISLKNYKES